MGITDHAIWWHVYPLGACGAPIRRDDIGADAWDGHRLSRLEAWLDYVVELGCNGLLLGPVFASTSHGYDTLDYFRLDPRLGDEDDWRRFTEAARARGLLLMLDGVFNHVGADHELVGSSVQGGGLVKAEDGVHRGWEGHGELAELDHADARVADLVVRVMCHWLERGADGWRLDVAYAVPADFWADVLARVRTQYPEAIFLGEAIHGDYPAMAAVATWDAVTAYELWKAVWSSIHDRNLWELAWALERHNAFARGTTMQTFVGNHDVTRIASQVGDAGAALGAVILMTVPGMPSIYYGDEQAFRGVKGTGVTADDEIRPALPDTPDQLASGGQWLHRLHQELIALRRRNPWIARGELVVTDKTNATITYTVNGDGHTLWVNVDIQYGAHSRIEVDGAPAFAWSE